MSGSLVFVTGSTGFIGSQVVAATLKAGYRQDLFKEALQGVDYVFHLASPMPGKGSDVQRDYIDPAVKGTEAILYAALEFPQIKKVVVVSSVLALAPFTALLSKQVSVKDNTGEIFPVDTSMDFPEGFTGLAMKYSASKILAHEATRTFLKNKKPHYTLITFHPTFVLGDSLVQKTAHDIGGMNALFWNSIESEKPKIANVWVHVRDVAHAHAKALETNIENGTEFLLSRPAVSWEHVVSFIKANYPALDCKLEPPFERSWTVDTTVADQILGLKWRSEEDMIEDVINQQLALGAKASI
ncbi:uncharacterized protein BDW43DRAFT_311088 [Aspergillus alliaceus]|uniref:uncharacterized protein n=1 Tax=Petromyces alliaceus TaxID=209559 RepID=UPI0012A4F35C|nr:uncharacterized protein BDW43DRAFT_311088 [Aspergillus alliaceus]KAB8233364.1 hypothetical protein BDW43DRAFT_311088 [Aspergillus alliaceus]